MYFLLILQLPFVVGGGGQTVVLHKQVSRGCEVNSTHPQSHAKRSQESGKGQNWSLNADLFLSPATQPASHSYQVSLRIMGPLQKWYFKVKGTIIYYLTSLL